ncbi:MAG: hypothetical protein GF331_27130 [Chitinivibrionales bacterium]|nr:hypothetical protein [Chitinivibrionales bacterium]
MSRMAAAAMVTVFAAAQMALGAKFVEHNGVVSIEAEHYTAKTGTWIEENALSGIALLQEDGCSGGANDYLMFEIDFTTTGTYYIWALGRSGSPNNIANDDLKVWLDTPSSQVHGKENSGRDYEMGMYRGEPADPSDWYYPVFRSVDDPYGWSNCAKDKEKIYQRRLDGRALSCQWDIDTPGKHTIHFVKGHEPEHCDGLEYGFDKLVIALDATTPPDGLGPAETTEGSVAVARAAARARAVGLRVEGNRIYMGESFPGGRVTLTGLDGRLVYNRALTGSEAVLSLPSLHGTYVLRLHTPEATVKSLVTVTR